MDEDRASADQRLDGKENPTPLEHGSCLRGASPPNLLFLLRNRFRGCAFAARTNLSNGRTRMVCLAPVPSLGTRFEPHGFDIGSGDDEVTLDHSHSECRHQRDQFIPLPGFLRHRALPFLVAGKWRTYAATGPISSRREAASLLSSRESHGVERASTK
jgi:hypothetical protein